ncbi:hypothetical protein G9A89_003636 [Geosiphon pyriformis]|nr:hypothetical protein G9A89_003636 [Geosiphon pyriformis]
MVICIKQWLMLYGKLLYFTGFGSANGHSGYLKMSKMHICCPVDKNSKDVQKFWKSYEQNTKLQKKQKLVEAEDNIEYLQMGNKSLQDVVHKSQVEERLEDIFEDNEADTVTEITSFDYSIIINDVEELQLELLPRQESRWIINKIDISEK